MFYHQVLLQRRGQFGLIWMEAMQSSPYRLTKRQAMQVNVIKSCNDILDYVYARLRDGRGKRTRISLYLSAHLMYGTVSIYRKQVDILLTDAQETKSRVWLEIPASEHINIKPARADHVTMPAAVLKAADDPFFGSFKHFDDVWDEFLKVSIQPDMWSPKSQTLSPVDRELELLEQQLETESYQPELGSPQTVANRAQITLKEPPFATSPLGEVPIPGEKDIPGFDGSDLEEMLAVAQDDEIRLLFEGTSDEPHPASDEGIKSPLIQAPTARPEESTPEKDTQKKEGRGKGEKKRRKRQQDDEMEETKIEEASPAKRPSPRQELSFELPLLPLEAGPRQRRHRRQLFVDTETQMTKDDLRHNLSTSVTTCRPLVILTSAPFKPAELLRQPGTKHLSKNKQLRRLWERNCVEGLAETESDVDFPIWSMPDLMRGPRGFSRVRRGLEHEEEELGFRPDHPPMDIGPHLEDVPLQGMDEVPSVEIERDPSLLRSGTPGSLQASMNQEDSVRRSKRLSQQSVQSIERERRDSVRASSLERSIGSSGDEQRLGVRVAASRDTSASAAPLGVLHEEEGELHLTPPPVQEDASSASSVFSPEGKFVRRCELESANGKYTIFRQVCPTTLNKVQAVKCFNALLSQCAEGKLFVRQFEPYGDIFISTRRRYLPRLAPESDSQ